MCGRIPCGAAAHKCLVVVALVRSKAHRLHVLARLALEQLGRRGALRLQRRAHADVHAQSVAFSMSACPPKLSFASLPGPLRATWLAISARHMVSFVRACRESSPPRPSGAAVDILGLSSSARPGLDQRSVHGQMFRGQQPSDRQLHDGIEETLRKSVSTSRSRRRVKFDWSSALLQLISRTSETDVVVEHLAEQRSERTE